MLIIKIVVLNSLNFTRFLLTILTFLTTKDLDAKKALSIFCFKSPLEVKIVTRSFELNHAYMEKCKFKHSITSKDNKNLGRIWEKMTFFRKTFTSLNTFRDYASNFFAMWLNTFMQSCQNCVKLVRRNLWRYFFSAKTFKITCSSDFEQNFFGLRVNFFRQLLKLYSTCPEECFVVQSKCELVQYD